MPKKHRLSHGDFKFLASARFRRERGKYFALSHGVIPGAQGNWARTACVVSKKVATKAVDRSLIKRRCRAAAKEFVANIKDPLTLVFYAGRNAKSALYPEVKKDIGELFHKLITRLLI